GVVGEGGEGGGEEGGRSGARGGAAEFGHDGLGLARVLANGHAAQPLDGGAERRGQRPAEEGEPDADQPLVGAQLEQHELARVGGRGQPDHERVVGGGGGGPRGDGGGLHFLWLAVGWGAVP